tara:strand:+ start:1205 stop:1363 length:159 start_codon:yes stop_codon:yes gene_type:complete
VPRKIWETPSLKITPTLSFLKGRFKNSIHPVKGGRVIPGKLRVVIIMMLGLA